MQYFNKKENDKDKNLQVFRMSQKKFTKLTNLTNVSKTLILDVVVVADVPLSLLDEVFQRYLSVTHIGQLVINSESCEICLMH